MTAVHNEMLGYDTVDIMVDVDDVIVPWFETVDQRIVQKIGYDGSRGPCNVWRMHEFYGIPLEEWENIVVSATADGLYTTTEPMPYAVDAINRLRWYGHRVHIVTARGFMANGENIRRWTREYLTNFAIGHDTLTFAKDKVEAMEALELVFDYAIDDGVHNYENLREAGVNVWLQNAPHNSAYECDRRVSSLWEFTNMVLRETTPLAEEKVAP